MSLANCPQAHGRNALSQSLSFLRRELGDGTLLTRGAEEVGVDAAAVTSDVRTFEEALAAEDWAGAVEAYGGDLLEGLHVVGSGPFTDWVDRERERLREAASGAAWKLAHAKIAAGELTEAERVAQRALMLVPTDESPVRGFIEALAGAGDRAAALRFYERFREVLAEELEVEPAPETVAVMEAVRGRTEAVEVVSVSVRGADESRRAGNAANLSAATGRRPRWKRPAVGIALLVVLVVIGYGLRRSLWSRVDGTGEAMIANRVAIFPFTVRGDDELAYLAEGMADLLATALDGAGAIVTVDPRAVIGVVEREATGPLDPELSRHIAARLGARRYVLGDILSAGGQIRARASLYEDLARPVASAWPENPVIPRFRARWRQPGLTPGLSPRYRKSGRLGVRPAARVLRTSERCFAGVL